MEQEHMNTTTRSTQENDIPALVEKLLRQDLYEALTRVNVRNDIVSCLPRQLYPTQIDMSDSMKK